MAKTAAEKPSTDVVSVDGEILDIQELNRLFGVTDDFVPDSITEIEAFFEKDGGLITFEGSPYTVIHKDELTIGQDGTPKPFVIINVRFYTSKQYGRDAVAVMALTADGRKVCFNDGSTGVFHQIKYAVQSKGRKGGFRCKGLRKSTYEWQEKDFDTNPVIDPKTGKPVPPIQASTYYIA